MKYRHALFLNPYVESASSTAMSLFPPTGLEYVATSARGHVGKLTLLDLRCEKSLCEADKLMDFIKTEEIDIICVGIAWNRHFEQICGLLNLMPDNIPLVVGGYKATEKVEEIFKDCPKVDIIVRGEGEETIKEIVKGAPSESILGISYRKGGEVIHNENRPLPDVNTVTPPDRALRAASYSMISNGVKLPHPTFDTILSSRGCVFNCKFCTFKLNPLGQKRSYSARRPESVIREIEGISADIILFSDDNFFTEPKRAEEICDLIIARGIKKRFVAQARIDIARHPELLEKITRAGFKMLLVGIESPHDHILAALNKGFDREAIRKYFTVLTRYPIFYHGNYIYGNLGETEKEMLYISKFSKEIGVDSVAFSKLRVGKYSPLRKAAEETPGYHVTERGELYSDTYSHAALKKIHRKLKFSFYTPFTLFKLAKKLITVGFVTYSEVMSFLIITPALLARLIAREIQKNRFGDSLKRVFISNK
jgi:magnesium-protoporphyrin IX monomethyl ester (oxidative) cyclase